jgi:heme-degrading monooxygenase HmoA
MHARVSHLAGSPENVEQGVALFRNSVLPELKSLEGNRGAILLVDRASGEAMSVTLWDNEAAMQASEERANEMRRSASEDIGAADEARVELYEVAVFET